MANFGDAQQAKYWGEQQLSGNGNWVGPNRVTEWGGGLWVGNQPPTKYGGMDWVGDQPIKRYGGIDWIFRSFRARRSGLVEPSC
jgi:hypothetical protein